jgi:putative hemolysin
MNSGVKQNVSIASLPIEDAWSAIGPAGTQIPPKATTVHQLARGGSTLRVGLARSPAEGKEAQRLRYSVFSQELGANLGECADRLDQDEFDGYCDHLLVRDSGSGEVVGTYRILPPHRREQLGRYYSESEFDL